MSVRDREEAVVARLHALPPVLDGDPEPGARAATRARLVAMAAVRTPEPAPRSRFRRLLSARAVDAPPVRWRGRLTAGLAGAALTVITLASLVAVAEGARPGDFLYDIKRSTEQSQLALAGDSRGQTLLDFASTRLDELEELAEPALVVETLRTMDDQTAEGAAWLAERAVDTADAAPLDRLAQWAAAQHAELAGLEPLVPAEATAAARASLDLLTQVGARTSALRPALGCTGGPAVAGTDDLGPVPAACPAAVETPGSPPGSQPSGSGTAPQGTAPQGTTPGQSPVPPAGPAPGTGPAQAPVPAPAPAPAPAPVPRGGPSVELPAPPLPTPATPRIPVPSLPRLPLPTPAAPSSAVIQVPPVGPIGVCLPPLLTAGC